ncbi:MAG TPA: hypothetical protein VMU33_02670 [Burkholderiaceae bacterium]|nr:hypothetical protein [Burkholderiaceae bacterium]
MTMMRTKRIHAALLSACAATVLAACGGGGDAAPSSGNGAPQGAASGVVPAAASASVASLIGWASTLPTDDSSSPLGTDAFEPPSDDGAPPTPIA